MLRYFQRCSKHITGNNVIFYLLTCVNILQDMARMDMKSERTRLGTYARWAYGSIQRPGDLAATGLFYTGYMDKVQCAFCHGVLKKWQKSDIPFDEHARHFPHCRFIRGLHVGNIPLSAHVLAPLTNTTHPHRQYTVPASISSVSVNRIAGACSYDEPVGNVDLTVEDNRLITYIQWPLHLPQTPATLAAAGFYHKPCVEKPDRVQCAYCKVKLYNWLEEDDPWITHAKTSPSCPYISLCMGADVVRDLLNQGTIQETNSCNKAEDDIQSRKPQSTAPLSPPSTPARRTIQDNITHHMNAESVQAVLEMGFSKDLVEKTVENCLKEDDETMPSASELASMVIALEEEQASPGLAPALPPTPLQRLVASRTDVPQAIPQQGITVNGSRNPVFNAMIPPFHTPNSHNNVITINGNFINGTTQHSRVWQQYRDPQRLREENARLSDRYLCKICMENQVRVTFLPCGHLACCDPCSTSLSLCPICRMTIEGHVDTYY
ncbi:baculoviral IAP repeat-containing protein 2-like [Haliotis rubra]|uniref:baculoviral IAP repeat-containing protein 2-like n=1 Tax=Haliotis rubra TaxID=36100 RepID=UPI001EE56F11|nr:baculoviral IAP repeat-containing protein 2-like [Haliotis rubra]